MMSCINQEHVNKPDLKNCTLCQKDLDEKIKEEFKTMNDKIDNLSRKKEEFLGTIFLLEQEMKKISHSLENPWEFNQKTN